MLTMKADVWNFLLALLLMCVSSNGQPLQRDDCETHHAPLGSTVLLPCIFSTNGQNWVSWTHVHESDQYRVQDLVELSSNRRVKFLDPRHGRVKTFPNQASVGNYSISIDELKDSDLGSYFCKQQKDKCFKVKLQEDKGEQFYEEPDLKESCKTNTLTAPLGSSVLLPCIFLTNGLDWVTWAHSDKVVLVHIPSNRHVKFLEPRHGRVKAFPNQASLGNFSISIDELKDSDLGSYICKQEKSCFQVDLLADKSSLDANMWLLIYICVGVAALVLLCVVGYFCWLSSGGLCNKRRQDNANNVSKNTEASPSAPPHEQSHEHQTGENHNDLVYENDDQYIGHRNPNRTQFDPARDPQHPDGTRPSQSNVGIYPNLEEFKFEIVESQRTRQRFHIELISRLRQASLSRHFYANQQEIDKQKAMATRAENQRARKAKNTVPISDCDYQNPIYNRSTDQLNRL